jgi:hypothetical protein
MVKKKRIRKLKKGGKNFPACREIIDKGGWIPQMLSDETGAYWDGFTAVDREGKCVQALSDSFPKEMVHLILDGAFGEQVKDAYLDQTHYWRIRDELITWPNQEAITGKRLAVVELRRRA